MFEWPAHANHNVSGMTIRKPINAVSQVTPLPMIPRPY